MSCLRSRHVSDMQHALAQSLSLIVFGNPGPRLMDLEMPTFNLLAEKTSARCSFMPLAFWLSGSMVQCRMTVRNLHFCICLAA